MRVFKGRPPNPQVRDGPVRGRSSRFHTYAKLDHEHCPHVTRPVGVPSTFVVRGEILLGRGARRHNQLY